MLSQPSEDALPHQDSRRDELMIQLESLLGNGVEYIALINNNGKIDDAVYRKDIKISKEKKEMFSLGIVLQNSMQRDFDEEFGSVSYTITARQNSKFVTIPTSVGILLAKLDKSADPFVFIKKISRITSFQRNVSR